jgi:hypothetical protein
MRTLGKSHELFTRTDEVNHCCSVREKREKPFLAPNRGVNEWPLLYKHFDRANGKSSGQDENGDQDRKPPPESIRVKDDDLSSGNVAMDSKQPDICNRKKGAR